MSELLALVNAVLPVLGIVGAGLAMRRVGWLSEEADHSLMRVTINLLMPCLIADTILGNAAFGRAQNVWIPPVLGFVTTAGGILAGWWTRRWLPVEPRVGAEAGGGGADGHRERVDRTYVLSVGICNYGYVPLPLAQVVFTSGTVGVLFVQNIGVELAMWLVGLAMVSGRPWREGWRHLANPPVLAIFGTLALNAVVSRQSVPVVLLTGARLLGQCAIPMGLILIGATVADLLPGLRGRDGMRWRLVLVACVVRLGILPAAILGLAWVLPWSREIREVLLLHAAMPAAVFPIVMARHFGGDPGTALRVVVGTSLGSVLTMPLWLKAGMVLLGVRGTPAP